MRDPAIDQTPQAGDIGGMTFAARMTRSPDPYDAGIGNEVAAGFDDFGPEIRGLIAGAAGCSPYLAGLLGKEGDWLKGALDAPEAAFSTALSGLPEIAPDQVKPALRQTKRRIALLAALADLAGVWSLEDVTTALTDLSDAACDTALKAAVANQVRKRKLPGGAGADGTAGMVILAMGKMGAFELNYSSDIDLICLFDETRHARGYVGEGRAALIRATREVTAMLSEITADGYVFRTDLRLRPDASVTPVCISMEAAERYYESFGRTWERAAFIKARAAAGDVDAGARFLQTLTPFVWRKHLDFAAIEDAHQMRLRIRENKRLYSAALDGLNLKLGRGGIREIEFFAQTRQLIAGGRDPSLRLRGTVPALEALSAAGWVPSEVSAGLSDHYRAHREVEHRVQMIHDAQTHDLPKDMAGWDRLAAFMGRDAGGLRSDITERLAAVDALTEGFFAPDPAEAAATPGRGLFGAEVVDRWPSYPALRSERAAQIFDRIKPRILTRLQDAANPNEALAQFDGFLRGLPAGVQLFSLFDANPELVGLIADICATAPALAEYLSRNASVLDAVIGGDFFAPWPGVDELRSGLGTALAEAPDYEAKLDAARRWAKEWHFRIGVHLLRGLSDADTAGRQYADLAEAVLSGLWPRICETFAERHGPAPGQGAVVLGMGSLGAGWLHAVSDLDLIVIYDAEGVEASQGPRPLSARAYFARLTQALVTALSAPMAEGRLYEVDMRLRPSGRQGPVATSLAAFKEYQRKDAWTWEHLALTRARAVAGASGLGDAVEEFRRSLLVEKSGGEDVLDDVARMRARVNEAKAGLGPFDAKPGPGRLSDIELLASTGALLAASDTRDPSAQLAAARGSGFLSADEVETVQATLTLLRSVQAAARLLTGGVLQREEIGEGARRLVLTLTGAADLDALGREMAIQAEMAADIIRQRLEG